MSALLLVVFACTFFAGVYLALRPVPAVADPVSEVVADPQELTDMMTALDAFLAEAATMPSQPNLSTVASGYATTPQAVIVARQIACGLMAGILMGSAIIPGGEQATMLSYNGDRGNKLSQVILKDYEMAGQMGVLQAKVASAQLVDGQYWIDMRNLFTHTFVPYPSAYEGYHLAANFRSDQGLASTMSNLQMAVSLTPGSSVFDEGASTSSGAYTHPFTSNTAQLADWMQSWASVANGGQGDEPFIPIWQNEGHYSVCRALYDRFNGEGIDLTNYGGGVICSEG